MLWSNRERKPVKRCVRVRTYARWDGLCGPALAGHSYRAVSPNPEPLTDGQTPLTLPGRPRQRALPGALYYSWCTARFQLLPLESSHLSETRSEEHLVSHAENGGRTELSHSAA